jgi:hypothetical protein
MRLVAFEKNPLTLNLVSALKGIPTSGPAARILGLAPGGL